MCEHPQYSKLILDRIISLETKVADAARCALISFDSTMRSNMSLGPPIDLYCYRCDSFEAGFHKRFADDDPYWTEIRQAWGQGLKAAFDGLPRPD